MNVKESKIDYKNGLNYNISLCNIRNLKPHFHNNDLELIFCLKGQIHLNAGHKHQDLIIKEGDIFSIDCRDIHYIDSDTDNLILTVHFDLLNQAIDYEKLKYLFFTCESRHCCSYQYECINQIKDSLITLAYLDFYRINTADTNIVKSRLVNKIMQLLYDNFTWFNYEQPYENINKKTHERMYRIMAYCSENFSKHISLTDIAELEHISIKYVSLFFSTTVFDKFNVLLKFIRAYEANHMLLTTNNSIYDISYAVGFSDPKYLYSAFKSFYQATPGEQRALFSAHMKKEDITQYVPLDKYKEQLTELIINSYLKTI